jgi:hypothetical protein
MVGRRIGAIGDHLRPAAINLLVIAADGLGVGDDDAAAAGR